MDDDFQRKLQDIRFHLGRINLSPDDLSALLRKRSGKTFSPAFLLALTKVGHSIPEYDQCMDLLDALDALTPPKSTTKMRPYAHAVKITDEMREKLNSELERTGIPVKSLALHLPLQERHNYTQRIFKWRYGMTKSIDPAEWQKLMNMLNALPDLRS